MLRIKRLYSFVLGTFLPLMLATYSVCLFILLMQFVWQYVNDMVGKGVGFQVMGELFFYACIAFTPMALPLAILLASLMTFGNLGEHLELLAMKASGISLLRIMKPLIWFVIVMAGISFLFQNDIAPRARAKMYTIVLSLKYTSFELDIPEGVFCKEIPGYNVYVRHKDKDGLLRDLMIYDYSDGFENAEVTVADSGRINASNDKKYLALTLHNGESFRNWGKRRSRAMNENIPYIRESFRLRDVLISFDMNFTMVDEAIMGSRDINKNMSELTTFIDSVRQEQDSVQKITATPFKNNIYASTFRTYSGYRPTTVTAPDDTLFAAGFEAYYNHLPPDKKLSYLQQAKRRTEQVGSDYNLTVDRQSYAEKQLFSHMVQYYQRYAMALSCILFFFIGAPLGAIIRKGGLGMPAVLSVFLYLLYYIIDTFGAKMAKQAVWPVWEGVWLSTVLLAGMGVFFTYKAVNDSTMIDPDAWKVFIQKLIGKREIRHYTRKEVIMTPPDYLRDIEMLKAWNAQSENYLNQYKKTPFYGSFWKNRLSDPQLNRLTADLESTIEDLLNSNEIMVIGKLMDYPVIRPFDLHLLAKPIIRLSCAIIFPVGCIIYGMAIWMQKQVNSDLITARKVNKGLIGELEKLV
ncbi:MAG: LptF/LptG family permease [Dysgonamonadaceae bacterium]|jgi:lipopolysaccharide export system permease protein|nr:LptF/LptG family permease [Dysgonamonadaceae bacterium]